MKTLRSLTKVLALLGLIGIMLGTTSARAGVLNYLVDINTSALVGNPSAPFSLDFQSNWASGLSQTVTLNNFIFTGGSVTGPASLFGGGVTGDLGSSLVFNASLGNSSNEYYQALTSGVTDIKFNLSLTTNSAGITPTSFSAAILDNLLGNIPTTAAGSDNLVFASIDGLNTTISGYNSTVAGSSTPGVNVTLTAIPEPSAYAGILGACALTAGLYRRQRRKSGQISA
jgi:hypothetical protein